MFWGKWLGVDSEAANSAQIAENRLKVLLISDRHGTMSRLKDDDITRMKLEISEVISKYIGVVQTDDIRVDQRKEDNMDVLEVSISLPETSKLSR